MQEPKGPEPEVPLPRRDEPDANPLFPPDVSIARCWPYCWTPASFH
jgi:hypothetical protein